MTDSKPDDIPDDIWTASGRAMGSPHFNRDTTRKRVARSLMAEREACAVIADERAAICADAVAEIEAGRLYKDIPTARATEDCARAEAEHIARLIRRDPGAHRAKSETVND